MLLRGLLACLALLILLSVGSCSTLVMTGFCFTEGRYLPQDERIRRAVISYFGPADSVESAHYVDDFIADDCCRYSPVAGQLGVAYQVDLYFLEDETPGARYPYRGTYLSMDACGRSVDTTGQELSEEAVERALSRP